MKTFVNTMLALGLLYSVQVLACPMMDGKSSDEHKEMMKKNGYACDQNQKMSCPMSKVSQVNDPIIETDNQQEDQPAKQN